MLTNFQNDAEKTAEKGDAKSYGRIAAACFGEKLTTYLVSGGDGLSAVPTGNNDTRVRPDRKGGNLSLALFKSIGRLTAAG